MQRVTRVLKSHLVGCGEEEFDQISRVRYSLQAEDRLLAKTDSAKVKAYLRKDSE